MNNNSIILNIIGWIFGIAVFTVGVLNLFLVHRVPAVVYLLLSIIYLPSANDFFKNRFGFAVPIIVKILLGIVVIMFTLGVSDLGDMFDSSLK